MTNMKATKRALVSSVLALVLCFAMLLGTTYAWFTDSVVSANNKITAGTLDVELWHHTEGGKTNITSTTDPIFSDSIVWEPGRTEVAYFSIKNNGSLDLKYKVAVAVTKISDHDLTEVMYYAITPDAKIDTNKVTAWVGNTNPAAKKLNAGIGVTETDAQNVPLLDGEEHFFALSIHMDEDASNKYMGESITFDIKVLAGQLVSEEGSFGKDYDEFAGYPGAGFAPAMTAGQAGVEIPVVGETGDKVGSVTIPAAAAADATAGFTAKMSPSNYKGNFTVAAGMETVAYDITVSNLKEGNTVPVKAQVRIAADLDPATVKLYHVDDEIACSYDPSTGYVTFETATFSPFTVVFDAESVYNPKPALPENIPTAKVTYYPDWVGNTEIEWQGFGNVGPSLNKETVADAAFIFECPTDVDEAYRNWLCDFYVSLDQNLGEDEIFLCGAYGSYLVGFHNAGLTLEAGKEIPLLGTALTGNYEGITNWTYDAIESFVGTFTCGVGNVGDSLNGATFKVALRLINPDNTDEYYDVNVVTYTFGGNYSIDGVTGVTTAQGLKDALENGASGEIQLGGNIDLDDLAGGN